MIRYFTVLAICLLFYASPHAQNLSLDTLTKKLRDPSLNDTTKVWVLINIAEELMYSEHNLDSAISVLNQALAISKRENFTRGIGWSYNHLGRVHNYKRRQNQALEYFLKGLKIVENSGDKLMVADYHQEIGGIYLDLQSEMNSDQMFQRALYHFRKCRELVPTVSSSENIVWPASQWPYFVTSTVSMGKAFLVHKNYDSAILYFQRGIELGKNSALKDHIPTYIDLIRVYEGQGDWNKALQLGRKVLGLALLGKDTQLTGKSSFLGDIYPVLAEIHLELNNYDSAYYFISKSIQLKETGKDIQDLLWDYRFLTNYYFKRGDYNKAILTAHQGIDMAKGDLVVFRVSFYNVISDSYAKQNNFKKSLEYHRLFSDLADSLNKENETAKVLGLQADYDAAKQSDAIDLLEKEAEINNLAIQRNRIIQYLIAGVLLLALVIIGIVANQYRLIRRSKREQERLFREVDTLKSRFFANISHEFRTPLTLILGPLEKRLSVVTDTVDKTELTLMHRNASRLLVLVNQLLDLSKVEAGQLKLNCQFADLDQAVQSIASQFSSMADSKGVHFQVRADEPVALFFDPEKLEKIINNLLSNAFKFTPPGGEHNTHS